MASPRALAVPAGGFREIAVLRLSSLGDVVLTLPVVNALRAAFPQAKLHYWVKEEFADLVRFDPAIDHVRALERDARKLEDLVSMSAELEGCDLIVDLHGSSRTRVLTFRQKAPVLRAPSYRFERWRWVRARWSRPQAIPNALARNAEALRPLGAVVSTPPVLHAGEAAERWAAEWIADWAPGDSPVALCPGARHATKRWPEARWCALDEALAARGRSRVVFTTPTEKRALPELAKRVDADPRARWVTEPIARMAALLSHTSIAVTHDSGLMHMAAGRGRRVVAIFGSTSPVLGFAPAGEGHEVLCRNEPCQPCTLHGLERCPKGHFRCMTGITVEDVLAALDRTVPRA
ncbi:MAG: glycosyltransferase family 9 protein [Candidatus Eisenbacteria bacterium]|uniref:Glycosyltransferase family 9 protein n=1 Tax=Eiseniibacteriota bacterium TaxID=2212470 RepID=A0A933SAX1_UNCEI|nr:glycosyltransferase family 9 protein [Candidatus Eisenbacteria bacterium]